MARGKVIGHVKRKKGTFCFVDGKGDVREIDVKGRKKKSKKKPKRK